MVVSWFGRKSLIGLGLAVILGCGGKNNEENARTPEGSQGSGAQSGRQGETGPKGDRGDKGDTGDRGETGAKGDPGSSASALAYTVKDSGGNAIAMTDFSSYQQFLFGAEIYARTSDGVSLKLNVNSGRNSGYFCYFASADCSGTCLHPYRAGEKNVVVESTASLYKVLGTETASTQSYQSYAVADSPAPSCTGLGSPFMASMIAVVTAWSPPAPLAYPFPAPIKVEAP